MSYFFDHSHMMSYCQSFSYRDVSQDTVYGVEISTNNGTSTSEGKVIWKALFLTQSFSYRGGKGMKKDKSVQIFHFFKKSDVCGKSSWMDDNLVL